MGTCGVCGARVDGSSFCTSCGAAVPDGAVSSATKAADAEVRPSPADSMAPNDAPEGRRSATLPALVIAGSVLLLVAVVGSGFILTRGGSSVSGSGLETPTVIVGSTITVTTTGPTAPETAQTQSTYVPRPAPNLRSGEAVAFIDSLYANWTDRDSVEIEQMVDPQYWGAFDPDFLDRIGVTSVDSYGNSESLSATTSRVCGYQRFYRDDGMSQEESRCFLVESTPSGLRVVWTGDQETLDSWSVT